MCYFLKQYACNPSLTDFSGGFDHKKVCCALLLIFFHLLFSTCFPAISLSASHVWASGLEFGSQEGSTSDQLFSCCQHTADLSRMRAEPAEVIAIRGLLNWVPQLDGQVHITSPCALWIGKQDSSKIQESWQVWKNFHLIETNFCENFFCWSWGLNPLPLNKCKGDGKGICLNQVNPCIVAAAVPLSTII